MTMLPIAYSAGTPQDSEGPASLRPSYTRLPLGSRYYATDTGELDIVSPTGWVNITGASNGTFVAAGVSAWAPLTPYIAGAVVTHALGTYEANAAHISGASFNPANWTQLGRQDLPAVLVGPVASGGDDSAALQAFFNQLSAASTPLWGILPSPLYTHASTLNGPTKGGTRVSGVGRIATEIRCTTANVASLQWTAETIHSLQWEDLEFSNANTPSAATPNQIGWLFNVAGGIGNGWWNWMLSRVDFRNFYEASAIAGTGSLPIWDWHGIDVQCQQISHTAFNWVSPTPIGMPLNIFENLVIDNTGGALVADGAALSLACELAILGLRVEGWNNTILSITGQTNGPTIRCVHVEHHTFTGSGTKAAFQFANTKSAVMEDVLFSGASTADAVNLIKANAGAQVFIRGFTQGVTGASVVLAATDASAGAQVRLSGLANPLGIPLAPAGAQPQVTNEDRSPLTGAFWPPAGVGDNASAGLRGDGFLVVLPFGGQVTAVAVWIAAATAGNLDVGIYSQDGTTKLGSSGAVAFGALVAGAVNIVNLAAPIWLGPGAYWIVTGSDNGNLTYGLGSGGVSKQPAKQNLAASAPLPASIAAWTSVYELGGACMVLA